MNPIAWLADWFVDYRDNFLPDYWQRYLWSDGGHVSGAAMTLCLLAAAIAIGFVLSVPLAVARVSKRRWVSGPVWFYTYVFRGTPLYVQLLLVYSLYGLETIKNVEMLAHFFQEGINCTILTFALNTCAYTTEIFAGAIKAVPHGEVEAARAYGMSTFTALRRVVLPSALRRALPAYSNEVILMLHATTVAFAATVPDILKIAQDANAGTYKTFDAYGTAALLYLVITFALVWLFRSAERRWLAYLRPRAQ